MFAIPEFYCKRGNEQEITCSDITQNLEFLGDMSTPAFSNVYQQYLPSDGSRYSYGTHDKSVHTCSFRLRFKDYYDFKLARSAIYRYFLTKESYRIRSDSEPHKVKYLRAVPFEIKPIYDGARDCLFSIPFENPSGYKYSLFRSDDPNFSSQFGMHLPLDRNIQYHFNTFDFEVYNPSDIKIDPYFQRHDLKIKIRANCSFMTITNTQNKTRWSILKKQSMSDEIIIDGINTYLNDNQVNNQTDYGHIVLEKGTNRIVVTGASAIDISFSFPFIYLE